MAKAARGKRGKTKPDTAANLGFETKHAELQAHRAEGADPEDRDEYSAASIFWVPKEARWSME